MFTRHRDRDWEYYTQNQTVNDGVAHSKNPRKCTYHVTFDLDLDLEHILDAGSPGDHRVQVWWRLGHLPGRRSDFPASTKVPVSRDLWPWPWAHPWCMLTWWPPCASLVAIGPFAWKKKRFSCQHKSARITWPLTLTLSTSFMHADLESILWKFGSDPAICLGEEAICAKVYRQTDDGRHAIALGHSWNELKMQS